MQLSQMAKPIKKIVVMLWLAMAAFTAIATIGTSFYFLAEMPRSPSPETGRVYPAVAANNTRVYVNRTELGWQDFLHYDLGTGTLCGVVALGIVLLVRQHKGAPPLSVRDLWS